MRTSSVLRRWCWRVGRWLYTTARGEGSNSITLNGEQYVQQCVLRATAGSCAIVFDIGANLGEWTASVIEATGGRAGEVRVYAFEPAASTFKELAQRFKHVSSVSCINAAVSDSDGKARMVLMSSTGGTNSLEYDQLLASQGIGFLDVDKTTVSLFSTASQINHIHLLKCDCEGHDLSVIRGSRGLLALGAIDVMQFEYNHRWVYSRSFLKDVFEEIDGSPYVLARVCQSRIELLREWHPELDRFFEANYLIVHERAIPWFDVFNGRFDASNTYGEHTVE